MKKLLNLILGVLLLLVLALPAFAQTIQPVTFPADEKPHSSLVEWYYYTGKVQVLGDESKSYGVEAVIFQFNFPGQPVYYAAHSAVTDIQNQQIKFQQDYNFVDQRPTQPPHGFKLTAGAIQLEGMSGLHHVTSTGPDFSFDLRSVSLKPVTLMNGNGYEQLGNGGMYYYSYVNMATVGTLKINGQNKVVVGNLWHDHQWGYMATDVGGWDWFSLRMDDMTELMGVMLRMADGSTFTIATYVKRDGSTQVLPVNDLSITPTSNWTSPISGVTYPSGWRVRSNTLDLSADITPKVVDQEIRYSMAPGVPPTNYWEGVCNLNVMRGGKKVGGYAYVELTGYYKQ